MSKTNAERKQKQRQDKTKRKIELERNRLANQKLREDQNFRQAEQERDRKRKSRKITKMSTREHREFLKQRRIKEKQRKARKTLDSTNKPITPNKEASTKMEEIQNFIATPSLNQMEVEDPENKSNRVHCQLFAFTHQLIINYCPTKTRVRFGGVRDTNSDFFERFSDIKFSIKNQYDRSEIVDFHKFFPFDKTFTKELVLFLKPLLKLIENKSSLLFGDRSHFELLAKSLGILDSLKNCCFVPEMRNAVEQIPSSQRFKEILEEKYELADWGGNRFSKIDDIFINPLVNREFEKVDSISTAETMFPDEFSDLDKTSVIIEDPRKKYLEKKKIIFFPLKGDEINIDVFLKEEFKRVVSKEFNPYSKTIEFIVTGHIRQVKDSLISRAKKIGLTVDPDKVICKFFDGLDEPVIRGLDNFSRTIFTCVFKLAQHGFISYRVAKEAIIKRWKSSFFKKETAQMLTKLQNKIKNAKRKTESCFSVLPFLDDENLLKERFQFNEKEVFIYYSFEMLKYIKENKFDILFLDGTHLNLQGLKNQLLIFRLHSSLTKETVTMSYVICSSRKTELYEEVLKRLKREGFFENLRILMTDFELGLKKAFKQTEGFENIEYRFCYVHLMRSVRGNVKSINKASKMNSNFIYNEYNEIVQSNPIPDYIAVVFSYLMFVKTHQVKEIFLLFAAIFKMTLGDSVELNVFLCFFYDNYIIGRFSENFFIDIGVSEHITNNFVEAVNSVFKRATAPKRSEPSISDWICYDTKTSLLKLGVSKKKEGTTCQSFKEFQEAINEMKLQEALDVIIEKVSLQRKGTLIIEERIHKITIKSKKSFIFSTDDDKRERILVNEDKIFDRMNECRTGRINQLRKNK